MKAITAVRTWIRKHYWRFRDCSHRDSDCNSLLTISRATHVAKYPYESWTEYEGKCRRCGRSVAYCGNYRYCPTPQALELVGVVLREHGIEQKSVGSWYRVELVTDVSRILDADGESAARDYIESHLANPTLRIA